MSGIQADIYRLLMGLLVVAIFFMTGRPYFEPRIRVGLSAITAAALNAFTGGALMGTPLSGIPLRFSIAFVGIGAGVAVLEWAMPEGGGHRFALAPSRHAPRRATSSD